MFANITVISHVYPLGGAICYNINVILIWLYILFIEYKVNFFKMEIMLVLYASFYV